MPDSPFRRGMVFALTCHRLFRQYNFMLWPARNSTSCSYDRLNTLSPWHLNPGPSQPCPANTLRMHFAIELQTAAESCSHILALQTGFLHKIGLVCSRLPQCPLTLLVSCLESETYRLTTLGRRVSEACILLSISNPARSAYIRGSWQFKFLRLAVELSRRITWSIATLQCLYKVNERLSTLTSLYVSELEKFCALIPRRFSSACPANFCMGAP
jgi:hypothetical protein